MAKRRPSSIAIGAISSTVNDTLSPGITISVPSGSSPCPSRPSCGSRTAGGSWRRTACDGHPLPWSGCRPRLELRVRRHRARLAQHLATLDLVTVDTAQQRADVVARFPRSSSLRNISTPVQVVFCVSLMPTISISSPTLITPRSTRAGHNRAAARDREHVLDRHQERLVHGRAPASGCTRPPPPSARDLLSRRSPGHALPAPPAPSPR
jgi:hypothetical protein